jgi:hypothetical protein
MASTDARVADDVVFQAWKDPSIDRLYRGWTGERTGANTVSLFFALQVISMMFTHVRRVVTPTSVVSQWVSEIQAQAPGIKVTAHMGPSRTKGEFSFTFPSSGRISSRCNC